MGWLSKLFKRKKKVEDAPKKEKESEINEAYVYKAGEKTIYDCIVEGQKLGLDMRVVNAKLSNTEPKEFIEWFEGYKAKK